MASRLIESGAVTEIAALKALSGAERRARDRSPARCASSSVISPSFRREIAMKHKLLPVLAREDRIFVAMAAPTDKKVIDEIEFVTGKRVFPYIALSGPLLRVIIAAYDMQERGESHYVGPSCPPEVLRKAGILSSSTTPPANPPGGAESQPPPSSRVPESVPANARAIGGGAAPVVVDDALRRMASADEPTDNGFGDADREVSGITEVPKEGQDPRDGKRTILIVDDEADTRKLLRRVFEDRGYRVVEADRGLVALRIVKEQPPDLMILDAMLPEVHGFDIARRMKGTELYGNIPIVMVSAVYRGWRFAEDVKTSYGVEAYLEKPFKITDVVAAVEAALEKRAIGTNDAERLLRRSRAPAHSRHPSLPSRRNGRGDRATSSAACRSIRSPTGSISIWACSTERRASTTTRSRSSRRRSTSTGTISRRSRTWPCSIKRPVSETRRSRRGSAPSSSPPTIRHASPSRSICLDCCESPPSAATRCLCG